MSLNHPSFPANTYHGYRRHDFQLGENSVIIIEPNEPVPGQRWVWRAEFFDAFPAFNLEMLRRGWWVAYMNVGNTFGCPSAMDRFDVFYNEMTEKYGFHRKPILEGLSRGGLYVYNWAARNPDAVGMIYADNPVCDFKSWPGGKGTGPGSTSDWQALFQCYRFESEEEALAWPYNPVDNLEPIIKAGIPMVHSFGDVDEPVPWEENTKLLAERAEALGGKVKLFRKPGCGHHPHGPEDPKAFADWVLENTINQSRSADFPMSASQLVLPTAAQVEWLECGIGVIIHFDVQVFEPSYEFREQWGYTPDPSVFNPANLDTDQWISTAKAAGANYAVLVAKHCSGFSLWPTEAHAYSVKSTPWRDGKGDIVGDFFASCKKFGLKPGLYCSAATNAYLNVDNPGIVRMGNPDEQARYNRIVEQQLTELWSNYGEVFYIWFDGGVLSPEDGGPDIVPLLKKLQPNAVVFQGPKAWPSLTRFTGNERAEAPDPFWNTTDHLTSDDGTVEVDNRGGDPHGSRWVCGESDMPNRDQKLAFQGGWFWREGDEKYLYSLDHMVECYFTSIARNTNLLIGMVIDPRGLVPESDKARFAEFGERMKQILSNRVASVSGCGDTLSLTLPTGCAPNMLMLREKIANGERIRKFVVEACVDGEWIKVWAGTVVGHDRIERFEPLEASALRLTVLESAAEPQIREFSAWMVEDGLFSVPLDMTQRCKISIRRGIDGTVEMRCSNPALSLRYTLDGKEPDLDSEIYAQPFPLPNGGTVKAHAFLNEHSHGATVTTVFGVDRQNWRVVSTSLNSPHANGGQADVTHLLNDDPKSYWHTYHTDKTLSAPPHEVVLDMGREINVAAFTLLPREDGTSEGIPDLYAYFLSPDGKDWAPAAEGEWTDVHTNTGMHTVPLAQPMTGRYLRFLAKHAVDDCDYVIVAGIGVIEA